MTFHPHRFASITVIVMTFSMTILLASCGDHQMKSRSLVVGATPIDVTIDASLNQPVIFKNTGSHVVQIKATDPEGNQDVLIFLGPGQTYQADPSNVRGVQVSQEKADGRLEIKTEYPNKVTVD
jgi:hypothetical protein